MTEISSRPSSLFSNRLVLTAIAGTTAIFTILALSSIRHHNRDQGALRRSNAVRRPRRHDWSIRAEEPTPDLPLGSITITYANASPHVVYLHSHRLPSLPSLRQTFDLSMESAIDLHTQLIRHAVDLIVILCLERQYLMPVDDPRWTRIEQFSEEALSEESSFRELADKYAAAIGTFLGGIDPALVHHFMIETGRRRGEQSTASHDAAPEASNAAEELKGVLYYIAEEQARRKAYQHRGIRCEECGESPIRNIRWHCLNCPDFDLCSTCKTLTAHQKNHIFAEIKIPVPLLAQPVTVLPCWYPGNNIAIAAKLSAADRRHLAHTYDYEEAEIDALADQFTCLANTPYDSKPAYLAAAIDREAFAKAMSSKKWQHRYRPELITERMFAFYDTDNAGKIGFQQYVSGIAYLRGKHRFNSLRRALRGFDLHGDGLVSRDDFIRLLRDKFELHRLLVEDIAECEEAELTRQILPLLHNNQPIGTVFSGDIPDGSIRQPQGKVRNDHGDMLPEPASHGIVDGSYAHGSQVELGDEIAFKAESLDAGPDDNLALRHLSHDEQVILGLQPTIVEQDNRNRQVGEALLWDIVEGAIHEALDVLFKPIETGVAQLLATKEERIRLHEDIDRVAQERKDFANSLRSGSQIDPLLATANHAYPTSPDDGDLETIQQILHRSMLPTDFASLDRMETHLGNQSLETLLNSSGYSLSEADDSMRGRPDGEPDPTLPQNRPNTSVLSETPHAATSRDRLEVLTSLNSLERHIHIRDGQACLSLDQIEDIAQADHTKEVECIIKSWLSWAAF